MQNQNVTTDPVSGKTYRLTPPKPRTAQFRALVAAEAAAKEAQASFMKANNLAYDMASATTVDTTTGVAPIGALAIEMNRLLAATRAAQQAIKAYKTSHPGEFVATPQGGRGRGIPIVNRVIRGRGRGRGNA